MDKRNCCTKLLFRGTKIILLNNFCNLLFMYFCTYKSTKKRLTCGFSIVLIAVLCKPLLEERCPKGGVVFASLPLTLLPLEKAALRVSQCETVRGEVSPLGDGGVYGGNFNTKTPQSLCDSSPNKGANPSVTL